MPAHQFPSGLTAGRDKWRSRFHVTPALAEASLEWTLEHSSPVKLPLSEDGSQHLTLSYQFTLVC